MVCTINKCTNNYFLFPGGASSTEGSRRSQQALLRTGEGQPEVRAAAGRHGATGAALTLRPV